MNGDQGLLNTGMTLILMRPPHLGSQRAAKTVRRQTCGVTCPHAATRASAHACCSKYTCIWHLLGAKCFRTPFSHLMLPCGAESTSL